MTSQTLTSGCESYYEITPIIIYGADLILSILKLNEGEWLTENYIAGVVVSLTPSDKPTTEKEVIQILSKLVVEGVIKYDNEFEKVYSYKSLLK